jgi:hypothetical protein
MMMGGCLMHICFICLGGCQIENWVGGCFDVMIVTPFPTCFCFSLILGIFHHLLLFLVLLFSRFWNTGMVFWCIIRSGLVCSVWFVSLVVGCAYQRAGVLFILSIVAWMSVVAVLMEIVYTPTHIWFFGWEAWIGGSLASK